MTLPQTQPELARTPQSVVTQQSQQLTKIPRAVDLVQNLEDGAYCLRIHHNGHIWWRELDGPPGDRIPAAGSWTTDRSFLGHYWMYLGTLRLAQGAYRLVQPAALAG